MSFLLAAASAAFPVLVVSLTVASTLPQLRRVVTTGVTTGLSGPTLVLSLVTFTLWLVYGLGTADPAQVANSGVALALLGVLTVLVGRATGAPWWLPVAAVTATALAAALVSWLVDPAVAAAAGAVLGVLMRLPQVQVAWSGADLAGLCPWATVLGAVVPAVWSVYGLVIGDPIVVASAVTGLLVQAAIMWRRLPPRRTLTTLAAGRCGALVAALAGPVAHRFPQPLGG